MVVLLLMLSLNVTAFAATINYVYDEQDRLHEVTMETTQKITYEYDEIGNIKSRTVSQSNVGSGSVTFQYGDGKAYYPSSNGWYTDWTPPSLGTATAVCNGAGGGGGGDNYNGDASGGNGGFSAVATSSTPYTFILGAAGGGGGYEGGGSGGAGRPGDKVTKTGFALSPISYRIYVGTGGGGAAADGNNGISFNSGGNLGGTITALGGAQAGAGGYHGAGGANGSVIIAWSYYGGATSLSISTSILPFGTGGSAYNKTMSAIGGVVPYTWSITSGSLPAGLTLNASSGVISGTPTTSAWTSKIIAVQVRDKNGDTATKDFTLIVAAPVSITSTTLPTGNAGSVYTQTMSATGGTMPYTWSITSGSLPAGLSLNTSSGVISGTPTSAVTSSFTIQVRDSNGSTASAVVSLSIGPALVGDGFITGTSLRPPWSFWKGVGSYTVTQTVAATAGHISNPAVDVRTVGTITASYGGYFYLESIKNRNNFAFWYKTSNVASSSAKVIWMDGTGEWVDDGDGNYIWQENTYVSPLITDGTWRQFSLNTFSTHVFIYRGFNPTSVYSDVHDYFDSFVEN